TLIAPVVAVTLISPMSPLWMPLAVSDVVTVTSSCAVSVWVPPLVAVLSWMPEFVDDTSSVVPAVMVSTVTRPAADSFAKPAAAPPRPHCGRPATRALGRGEEAGMGGHFVAAGAGGGGELRERDVVGGLDRLRPAALRQRIDQDAAAVRGQSERRGSIDGRPG